MALNDISDSNAVLSAMREYDTIGEEAFLSRYGFAPSRKFWVLHDGRRYASKALLAAAHGRQFPQKGPLAASDLSGGDPTIRQLQSMGFALIELPTGTEVPRLR
jgi:hypothetical protein